VFAFLEQRLGVDYRLLGWLSDEERAVLTAEWRWYSSGIDARRKLLVERHGLCLLIAYVLQGIQQAEIDVEELRAPWNRRN
jgi:hypothetical protein